MTPAKAEPVERFAHRYGVEIPWTTGSDDAEKHAALESAEVAVCCAKAGVQVLSAELLARCGKLVVAADVNAVPPSGIEGLEVTGDGAELSCGALGIGALAIGGVKYGVQRGLLERMMSADRAVVLDFPDAFDLARDMVSA
jgi:methylene-tetrahydromethanopterin dehydrogenase